MVIDVWSGEVSDDNHMERFGRNLQRYRLPQYYTANNPKRMILHYRNNPMSQ
jgi:hypothetical protein